MAAVGVKELIILCIVQRTLRGRWAML